MKVKLTNVRLAFPQLFEAKAVNGEGEPRFGAAFVIEPKSENAKLLANALTSVANEKWTKQGPSILSDLKRKGRVCYIEGPKTSGTGEVYEGFEDKHSLQSSSKVRPLALNKDKTPLTEKDGVIYAGCFIDAIVEVWAQDNQFGKRINAQLKGVQFRGDGDAFSGGGKPASADEFEDLSATTSDADDLVA